MDIKEVGLEGINSTHVVLNTDQWWVVANTTMNLLVPYNADYLLASWALRTRLNVNSQFTCAETGVLLRTHIGLL
jgi:hypothetical protein